MQKLVDGRYLLDTNIVIALLSGDVDVLFHLDGASEVFVPAVVIGELFFGAAKSDRAPRILIACRSCGWQGDHQL